MGAPANEREALERERKALADHVPNLLAELTATALARKARRAQLLRQLRQAQTRLAEVDARLRDRQS